MRTRLLLLLPLLLAASAPAEDPPPLRIEKILCLIVRVAPAGGESRDVEIDRGAADGIVPGWFGRFYALGEKPGDSTDAGQAVIVSTLERRAVVRITPADPARVPRPGDYVEIDARVPAIEPRSLLWTLAKLHVDLETVEGAVPLNDYALLRSGETPELVSGLLARMQQDVRDCAVYTDDVSKEPYAKGRYAGRTCRDVMEKVTEEDLLNFLRFVISFPGKYQCKRWRFAEVFATWVMNEAPGSHLELVEDWAALPGEAERLALLDRHREEIVEGGWIDSWQGRAQALSGEDLFVEANLQAEIALAAARRFGAPIEIAWSHFARGYVWNDEGRLAESTAAYEEALAIFRGMPDDENARRGEAFCLNNLSVNLIALDRYRESLERAREGLARKIALGRPPGELWTSHKQIGDAHYKLGEYKEAAEAFRASAEDARAAKNDSQGASSLLELAKTLAAMGEFREAAHAHEEVVATRRRLRDEPGEATALMEAASALWSSGDYRAAIERYEAAREIRARTGDRAGTAEALGKIGTLRWNLGEYDPCRAAHEEALRIRRELEDRAGIAWSLKEIGDVFRQSGEYGKALDAYREALGHREALEDRAGLAELHEQIGLVLWDRSEWDESRKAFDRAVDLYRAIEEKASLARSLRNRGVMRDQTFDRDGARADFEESLRIREAIDAKSDVVDTLLCLAGHDSGRRAHEAAIATAKRAIDLAVAIGDRPQTAYGTRCLARYLMAEYRSAEAIPIFERSLALYRAPELDDRPAACETLLDIARANDLSGDFRAAAARAREALALAEECKSPKLRASALDSLGGSLRSLGDLKGALAAHTEQMEILAKVGNEADMAGALWSMALVWSDLGEGGKALEANTRALETQRKLKFEWGVAALLNNRSNDAFEAGDFAAAEADLNEGLSLAEKLGDRQLLSALCARAGDLRRKRGEYADAIAFFERAVEHARAISHKRFVANCLVRLAATRREWGRATLGQGDVTAATAHFDAAVPCLEESGRLAAEMESKHLVAETAVERGAIDRERYRFGAALASLREGLRTAEEVGSRSLLVQALHALGLAEELTGDLDGALAHGARAVTLLDEMRGSLSGSERAQTEFLRKRIDFYEWYIDLLGKMQVRAADAKERARLASDALRVIQSARFALFKRGVEGEAAPAAGESAETEAYRKLERDIARLAQERDKARAAGDWERAEGLEGILASTEEELVSRYADLKTADPDLASRLQLDPQRIGDAMRRAPAGATLLLLFPGERSLHTWVLTREGLVEWRQHAVSRAEIYRLVGEFRDRMEQAVRMVKQMGRGFGPEAESDERNPAWYRENIRALRELLEKLYGHLIAPVASHVKGADPLLLLPYGELNYLPFEALLPPGDAKEARFLGEEKRVVYLLSERHLFETLDRLPVEPTPKEDVWVAFADPRGRLASSLEEAYTIQELFAKSEVYTKETGNATEAQVERLREDCSILHIATHGFLNAERPSKTFLEFATPPGDGMLAYGEIGSRLKRRAPGFVKGSVRLVVLSACDTARAQDNPEAEVLGMPDAFVRAGAPAVLASLWSVYTYSTTDTMIEFYRRLAREHQDKATALMGAKRALLRDGNGLYAHPFFWSPFLLFGDWR